MEENEAGRATINQPSYYYKHVTNGSVKSDDDLMSEKKDISPRELENNLSTRIKKKKKDSRKEEKPKKVKDSVKQKTPSPGKSEKKSNNSNTNPNNIKPVKSNNVTYEERTSYNEKSKNKINPADYNMGESKETLKKYR